MGTREQHRKTLQQAADEFLLDCKLKLESATFAAYALGHVTDHLGGKLVVEITPTVVKRYQTDRLAEKAGPKTTSDHPENNDLQNLTCKRKNWIIFAVSHTKLSPKHE